jgi:hypothetical protein
MANPSVGLRTLLKRLRPGGFCGLGLYSTIAREPVRRTRQWLAKIGLGATPEDIRQARHRILTGQAPDFTRVLLASSDFYSLSGCRDLIFHEQECTVDLPWIQSALDENGLDFLGFEFADPEITGLYDRRFPRDGERRSLANWHRLEQEQPWIFGGMYQFWALKRGLDDTGIALPMAGLQGRAAGYGTL